MLANAYFLMKGLGKRLFRSQKKEKTQASPPLQGGESEALTNLYKLSFLRKWSLS